MPGSELPSRTLAAGEGRPTVLTAVREQLGQALFRRVAGPDGPATRARIHHTPGPRWFGPDRPIRTVHGDTSMFIGGLSALLLQSLHPLAMGAVAGHSGYRGDPWGRLQRTSTFLAVTTYGTAADAQRAVDHVRAIHEHICGTTAEGSGGGGGSAEAQERAESALRRRRGHTCSPYGRRQEMKPRKPFTAQRAVTAAPAATPVPVRSRGPPPAPPGPAPALGRPHAGPRWTRRRSPCRPLRVPARPPTGRRR